ncbi:MAG: hypothetical protein O7B99_14650 [Planctomycetota bacterium]|nr:hypothetical protein [Planctomycetota bacterium]
MTGGFGVLDWAVVLGFLVVTTVVGGRMAGKQATLRDFFLGGRKLPWYAVAGSIIATEISAVTFISFPFVVFRPGGDLTYLQLGIFGLLLARLIVGYVLVPAYYEREIYSPYDFMGNRLGPRVRATATSLFALGGVLAQAARVYLTAVVLEVLLHDELDWLAAHTGIPPLVGAVASIGVFAVLWTLIGGIATVVWTDVILFLVFLVGIAIAFFSATSALDGGAAEVFQRSWEAGKFRFLDFDTDPTTAYTIWAAIIANTVWGVGAFGTDQLLAQRILCCRDARDARKAVIASYAAMLVTVLVGFVGMALFAYYEVHPLEGAALALYEAKGDRIFPIFIFQVIPSPLKGLVVAGVFAAAISSLDSILAALSQSVLQVLKLPQTVRASRVLVVVFGVLLCVMAVLMERVHEAYPSILDLALAMAGYTVGALFAGFALAFWGRGIDGSGYVWSAPLGVMTVFAVAWHEPWSRVVCLVFAAGILVAWIAARRRGALDWRMLVILAGVGLVLLLNRRLEEAIAFPWFAPIGFVVAFGGGWLLSGRAPLAGSERAS